MLRNNKKGERTTTANGSHIIREPMDYTEWRQDNLFNGMSIESISREAMDLHNSQRA